MRSLFSIFSFLNIMFMKISIFVLNCLHSAPNCLCCQHLVPQTKHKLMLCLLPSLKGCCRKAFFIPEPWEVHEVEEFVVMLVCFGFFSLLTKWSPTYCVFDGIVVENVSVHLHLQMYSWVLSFYLAKAFLRVNICLHRCYRLFKNITINSGTPAKVLKTILPLGLLFFDEPMTFWRKFRISSQKLFANFNRFGCGLKENLFVHISL